MKKTVESTIEKIVEPILLENNFELVDVEYVLEMGHRYLRVYIDKENGISLDDCKVVSEKVSEKLDKIDPIKEEYFLEICSPGLDRPLKKERDFERYKGRDVELKTFRAIDGKKQFEGTLIGLFEDVIKINEDGKTLEFNKKDISIIRLAFKF